MSKSAIKQNCKSFKMQMKLVMRKSEVPRDCALTPNKSMSYYTQYIQGMVLVVVLVHTQT